MALEYQGYTPSHDCFRQHTFLLTSKGLWPSEDSEGLTVTEDRNGSVAGVATYWGVSVSEGALQPLLYRECVMGLVWGRCFTWGCTEPSVSSGVLSVPSAPAGTHVCSQPFGTLQGHTDGLWNSHSAFLQ